MGKEICLRCHGKRFAVCNVCGGSGKGQATAAQEYERKAEGMRPTPCRNCNGTGSIKCPLCQGTGYIGT